MFGRSGKPHQESYPTEPSLFLKKLYQDLKRPIFAFTIRDARGTELCGTNTLLQEQTVEHMPAGTAGVVRFRQRMLLQGGEYFLSLGLTGYEGDTLAVHHRLYDVCSMQVLSDRNTIGVFDMESEITYEQTDGGTEA